MEHKKYTNEEMLGRIVRFNELKQHGIPLMFIDSVLPGHRRMNYAVIGDTASENPDFENQVALRQPHKFQIGMVMAPPGNGPAFHTHDYIEAFMPLTGRWRYYWGNSPDEIEGEAILEPWDWISLPPGVWRGFENIGEEDAWLVGVLEPHDVFTGKDPYWSQGVIEAARRYGFEADEHGCMIKPGDYQERLVEVQDYLLHREKDDQQN
jgi:quercetin dioxygenase-like cupin family protein